VNKDSETSCNVCQLCTLSLTQTAPCRLNYAVLTPKLSSCMLTNKLKGTTSQDSHPSSPHRALHLPHLDTYHNYFFKNFRPEDRCRHPVIRKMKHNSVVKLTDSYLLEAFELSLGIEEAFYDMRVN
jgi:hypothetical protein